METPIQRTMAAIRQGTLEEFRNRLGEHPGLLEAHGPHLLEHAATNDRFDIMAFLVQSGVNVNDATAMDTPLSAAARDGSVESVQWLLDRGADINGTARPGGSSPLHEAIMEQRLEIVEILIERGADPNILYGNPRKNALAAARFWGSDEIAAFLEARGIAEITARDAPIDVETAEFLDRENRLEMGKWYEKKWPRVYEYAIKNGLQSLGERNRTMFLVGYLIDQLADGGTDSVYRNPSANYVREMVEALESIGAARVADLVRAINAMFPGGKPDPDHQIRGDQVDSIRPDETEPGQELEAILDEYEAGTGQPILLAQLHTFWYA